MLVGGGGNKHWVDSPAEEGVATNSAKESLGLAVLAGNGSSAVNCELVDYSEVCNASNGKPSPLLSATVTESSKETSQDHNEVCDDGNKDICTRQTSKERKIQEQEWRSEKPIDISCPVDLAVDYLICIRHVLVMRLFNCNFVIGNALANSHGEVGEESEGRDESRQNVEQAFLLELVSFKFNATDRGRLTTGTRKAMA